MALPCFSRGTGKRDPLLAKWGCIFPPSLRAGIATPLKAGFDITCWGKHFAEDIADEAKELMGIEYQVDCKYRAAREEANEIIKQTPKGTNAKQFVHKMKNTSEAEDPNIPRWESNIPGDSINTFTDGSLKNPTNQDYALG